MSPLRSGEAESAEDKRFIGLSSFVGDDPLPYGIKSQSAVHHGVDRLCVPAETDTAANDGGRIVRGSRSLSI